MVDVLTEILIACPREEVAKYACDPDNAPEWYVNIKVAEWVIQKPLTLGSKIAFTAQFLGRKLAYVYEIIELIPSEKMVMRTANGPFPMETTYTWKSMEEGQTHMTLRNKGVASGFSKIFSPIMASAMKRANKKDLDLLKHILEK
jgi:hypothetical protein